jgi:hypothetical protein
MARSRSVDANTRLGIGAFLNLLQMYAYVFQGSRIDILDLAVVCFLVDNVPGFPHCVLRFAARVMKPNLCALYNI